MKKKEGSATHWIIFSVVIIALPIILGIIVSHIINDKPFNFSEFCDNIILMLFSVTCSLLSICHEVNQQKKDKKVKHFLIFSIVLTLVTWTFYTIFLTKGEIDYAIIICVICFITIIVCSILGIIVGKKSDKNTNDLIFEMHNNCNNIRKNLLSEKYNRMLEPHITRQEDLLCNPEEFDRVTLTINNFLENGDNNHEQR